MLELALLRISIVKYVLRGGQKLRGETRGEGSDEVTKFFSNFDLVISNVWMAPKLD